MTMQLATLSQHVKKPTKVQAQALIREMYREDMGPREMDTLARLYALFMPPKPKKAKTPFQWVTKAMPGKNEVRYYLQYIHVTEDGHWIEATDGHRMHRVENKEGMAPGFYLLNGDKVSVDANFPDVNRVCPDIATYTSQEVAVESLEIKERAQFVMYVLPNGQYVNKKYLDDVANGEDYVNLYLYDSENCGGPEHNKQCVYVDKADGDRDAFAVIMPMLH